MSSTEHSIKSRSSTRTIKSVKKSSTEITVVLDDGSRVSVTPEQLLRVASEDNLDIGDESDTELKTPTLTDDKKKKNLESLRRLSMEEPTQLSLSNLLAEYANNPNNHNGVQEDISVHSRTSTVSGVSVSSPSTKNFMKQLRRNSTGCAPTDETKSLNKLPKVEEFAPVERARSQSPTRQLLKTRDELNECSTHECFTNLIDPGDLMKINGFKSKPKMNGATVEVIRKSKGTKGKRWDVRVISKKHIQDNASFNSKRLISVAIENLKHFV